MPHQAPTPALSAQALIKAGWPLLLALAAGGAQAQGTPGERACADAVQGKVAWSQRGDRSWQPANLARLCEGSNNPAATVRCFEAQIREHNDWNRGINACKGQAAAAAAPAAAGANGRNVSGVDFGSGGQKLGRFQQAGAQRWIEFNASGQVAFRFEETGRDDWSVYLTDRSRGVNIQLDLHTKKVMYSDANTPRRVQYDVLVASAAPVQAPPPPVAQAPAPAPYQPPPPAYTPPPAPAPAPQYTAPAPQYTPPPVQYTPPPAQYTPPAPQYTPPPPVAAPPAGPSVRFGQGGRPMGEYRQVAPGRWVEVDAAGNVGFRFDEAGRDDRSIYLFDRSRGVHIELGLQSRKVMYGDPQSPRRPLYDVLDANF